MNRLQRRKSNRDKQKYLLKKSLTPKGIKAEKLCYIILSLIFIITFSYLAFRNDNIHYSDLKSIPVTLLDTPKYIQYKVKHSTYNEIILTTKEYQKKFVISSFAFKATNHTYFKTSLFPSDKIEFLIKEKTKPEEESISSKHTEVYGVLKNNYNYINLDKTNNLTNNDKKWYYVFILCGLVIMPYGFIKRKPKIEMETALFITVLICIIFRVLI